MRFLQYDWDIFISYRRMDESWVKWTKLFANTLRSVLQPGIEDPLRFFFDEQIETGAKWPRHIATAHARSKILIPILSRNYFISDWCKLELGLMLERAQICRREGLIHPVVIDDGDRFPDEVAEIKPKKLHDFANPILIPESAEHQALGKLLLAWKPTLVQALDGVPRCEARWGEYATTKFVNLFKLKPGPALGVSHLSLTAVTIG
jgi:TIR domain